MATTHINQIGLVNDKIQLDNLRHGQIVHACMHPDQHYVVYSAVGEDGYSLTASLPHINIHLFFKTYMDAKEYVHLTQPSVKEELYITSACKVIWIPPTYTDFQCVDSYIEAVDQALDHVMKLHERNKEIVMQQGRANANMKVTYNVPATVSTENNKDTTQSNESSSSSSSSSASTSTTPIEEARVSEATEEEAIAECEQRTIHSQPCVVVAYIPKRPDCNEMFVIPMAQFPSTDEAATYIREKLSPHIDLPIFAVRPEAYISNDAFELMCERKASHPHLRAEMKMDPVKALKIRNGFVDPEEKK